MNEAAVTFETYKSCNPAVNRQQCFRTARGMNWTANRGSQRESWEGESPGGRAVSEWAEMHRTVTSPHAAVSSGGPVSEGPLHVKSQPPGIYAFVFFPQNREERRLDCVKREKKIWRAGWEDFVLAPRTSVCGCPRERAPIRRRNGPTWGVCTADGSGNLWSGSGAAENPRLRSDESRCCSVFTR